MKTSTRRKFIKSVSLAGLLTPVLGAVCSPEIIVQKSAGTAMLNPVEKDPYLAEIKEALMIEWPKNKTINLVFHGHSVPSGYFKTPEVKPLQSYPFLLLKDLKKVYPLAVINIILTCIGGENSSQGAGRFKKQVLNHKPDVLFIDYALNDRGLGLEASRKATEYMIKEGLRKKIKIILLTPTPDQRVQLLDENSDLQKLSNQIIELSSKYQIGLADSYAAFQKLISTGEDIIDYMSQVNHPNEKGHQVVSDKIMKYF